MLPALLVGAHHETLEQIEARAQPRKDGEAFPLFTEKADAQAWQFVKSGNRRVHRMGDFWMPNGGTHPPRK